MNVYAVKSVVSIGSTDQIYNFHVLSESFECAFECANLHLMEKTGKQKSMYFIEGILSLDMHMVNIREKND